MWAQSVPLIGTQLIFLPKSGGGAKLPPCSKRTCTVGDQFDFDEQRHFNSSLLNFQLVSILFFVYLPSFLLDLNLFILLHTLFLNEYNIFITECFLCVLII